MSCDSGSGIKWSGIGSEIDLRSGERSPKARVREEKREERRLGEEMVGKVLLLGLLGLVWGYA